jgi:hypothetical protein
VSNVQRAAAFDARDSSEILELAATPHFSRIPV